MLVKQPSRHASWLCVFGETGAIAADADATVEVNIQRMDADRAGAVVLAAQVAVTFAKTRRPPNTRAVGLKGETGDAGHAKRSCGDERRAGATRRCNRRDVAGLEKSYIASAWLPV